MSEGLADMPESSIPNTRNVVTRRLADAGTGPDHEIAGIIKDFGLAAVVDALVTELISRCNPAVNERAAHIALDVTHGDAEQRVVLEVAHGRPIRLLDEPPLLLHARFGFAALDLTRRLFGRTDHRRYGDFHNSFMPTAPDPESIYRELADILLAASQATDTVMSGCGAHSADLGSLAVRYGSDKWASFHWYTTHYERHFAALRDEPVRILEIGIGGYDEELGGGSLKMWKRYFHRGEIFGLDIFDKTALNEPRLNVLVADQNDAEALTAIAREHGPFDVIIDDGSHVNEHVRTSFRTLFPLLRSGGIYVVEDLQTSYFPSFGGTAEHVAPPETSVGLIKQLLDDLHHQERMRTDPPTVTEQTVTGVHAYHNIAFIEKGVNGEDALPAWMDADAWEVLGATDT